MTSLLRRAINAKVRKLEASAAADEMAVRRVGPALDLCLDFGREFLFVLRDERRDRALNRAAFREEMQAAKRAQGE